MSYLYRPTPVMNPGLPPRVPLRRLPAGTMHGYVDGVNWKSYFDSARAATQGTPWIVRSGSMGSFVLSGMGDDSIDFSNLPLAPVDTSNINLDLSSTLPPDFFNMPAPIAPSIAPYSPGPVSAAPSIVSSGGSVLSPAQSSASAQASTPWASIVSSLTSFGTSIAKAATGQQINPAVAPAPPQTPANNGGSTALVAQAQSLQAQAAALQASNPALAAQYTAQANALLAQAGAGTSWFTQSTLIPGLSNQAVFSIGAGLLVFTFLVLKDPMGRGK